MSLSPAEALMKAATKAGKMDSFLPTSPEINTADKNWSDNLCPHFQSCGRKEM